MIYTYKNLTDAQILEDVSYFDYIEVKPFDDFENDIKVKEEYLKRIIKIARNAHQLIMGVNGIYSFLEESSIHFYNTTEMLDIFSFLKNNELIYQLVIGSTNKLPVIIDDIREILKKEV